MKKILLIDDSNKLNSDYVNRGKYSSVLERISDINDFSEIGKFEDYECVLIHLSFGGNKAASSIVKTSTQMGTTVPVVEFSLSQYSPDSYSRNGASYTKLNKETFYKNLEDFITIYQDTNKLNFDVLMYGKEANVEQVRMCATRILKIISVKHSILSEVDIEPIKKDFETLFNLSQPSIGIQYDEFLHELHSGDIDTDVISYKVKKISESFSKYGKNIYHW